MDFAKELRDAGIEHAIIAESATLVARRAADGSRSLA
jgi:hypothetical protein